MPKPYPQEFRDDVVKVARSRPEGTTLEQVAKDFGIHPMTLSGWMKKAAKKSVGFTWMPNSGFRKPRLPTNWER